MRVLLLAATLAGCGGQRAADGDSAPQTSGVAAAVPRHDTLRGMLSVAGADPARELLLTTGAGRYRLLAPREGLLWRADGLEVCVRYRGPASGITVLGFSVRGIGGRPALDGVVQRVGDSLVLLDAGGAARPVTPIAAQVPPGTRLAYSAESGALAVLGEPRSPPDSLGTSCDASTR